MCIRDSATDTARRSGVLTHGSSRTDAGVHALDATLHVDLERVSRRRPTRCVEPFTAHAVMSATNHFLKRAGDADVRVWDCVRVDPAKFHARYCATARTYVYRIRVSPTHRPPGVFESGKVWHVARDEPLDVARMREAARSLVGARDFSSFRARGCQAKSAVRTVEAIEVESDDALAPSYLGWFPWSSWKRPSSSASRSHRLRDSTSASDDASCTAWSPCVPWRGRRSRCFKWAPSR